MMQADVVKALASDQVIDITTTGRRSGQPRRIEIWFHRLNDRYYITGRPGQRSWYANLVAQPDFTFHLKESAQADLPARARAIIDPDERQTVLAGLLGKMDRLAELADWVVRSPLVEITFPDES